MPIVLKLDQIGRTFRGAAEDLAILKSVDLVVSSREAVAVRGPSGCGKSTLLQIAGTLDQPTSGIVEILGQNPWLLNARDLAAFRNQHIGFIFQDHQLLPQCTLLENVLLPTLAGSTSDKQVRSRARELLDRVGLSDRMTHRPGRLSGGERQRAAVCRALVYQPSLLLADEPTGSLDPATADVVGGLLLEMASEHDAALVCVTHSDAYAGRFPRTVTLSSGDLVEADTQQATTSAGGDA